MRVQLRGKNNEKKFKLLTCLGPSGYWVVYEAEKDRSRREGFWYYREIRRGS